MPTAPLHKLLELDIASALLANFAQLFAQPFELWLIDDEGQLVGCHPAAAQHIEIAQLMPAVERLQHSGRMAVLPIGIALPVRVRGHMAGALIGAAPADLEAHGMAALQLLARVLSLLAENKLTQHDLVQESIERYRELNLLYRAGESMATSLDLPQVNQIILEESARLIQADEGAVMLRDRESGALTVWASHGIDGAAETASGIPFGHEVAERVMQTGEIEIVEQPALGARTRPLNAVLCVPLKIKDEVLGVISLGHTNLERSFLPTDVSLINALTAQAAVAIDNARMYSDLSKLRDELEAANTRLLELNELKSSFLGTITHELRSPFANIGFSLQLIERYGTATWSEEQQVQWKQLTQGVREAKLMIDNLISFAGLLSRQGDLFLRQEDFSRVVQEVTTMLEPVARTRRIKFLVDGAQSLPMVQADATRLGEAVYHLVHNAIKYNRPGGAIRVQFKADGPGIAFEVRDTGVGIAPEKLERLWDPFAQDADPLKRGREGLGLGLSLVRYVIQAHGGRVSASSQEGVGSTFRFWVPIAGPGRANAPPDAR